jgi:23S rRNA-/tRNA-specific pseudouridylate synthase
MKDTAVAPAATFVIFRAAEDFAGLLAHADKIIGVSEDQALVARLDAQTAGALGECSNSSAAQQRSWSASRSFLRGVAAA